MERTGQLARGLVAREAGSRIPIRPLAVRAQTSRPLTALLLLKVAGKRCGDTQSLWLAVLGGYF